MIEIWFALKIEEKGRVCTWSIYAKTSKEDKSPSGMD
jgi:hypothetical protein